MNTRARYILMGLTVCAAVSFVTASCMTFFSGNDKKEVINVDELDLVQTREPENGAPTATIRTSEGDIEVVLFPDKAPEAVKHFQQLADSGYYDNTYVFNSKRGSYFSAGSPVRSGGLDDDKPEGKEEYKQEISTDLWPFRGALCSIPSGASGGVIDRIKGDSYIKNGSRFAILNSEDFTDDFKKELLDSHDNKTLANLFIELRGIPSLSQQVTIFGQTYEGFDVIDKLTSLETEEDDDGVNVPVDSIMIKTIETGTYKKTGSWALTTSAPQSTKTTSTQLTSEQSSN